MSNGGLADVPIDLQALADELLTQAAGEPSQRAARTLPHPVDGLRQTVIALHGNARLHDHNSPGPASLLVLRGRATLAAGDLVITLEANQHTAIPPRRHSLSAEGDAVVLLSVALTVQPASRPASSV
jgi:quercetin dioxygenase-like cupin family protein